MSRKNPWIAISAVTLPKKYTYMLSVNRKTLSDRHIHAMHLATILIEDPCLKQSQHYSTAKGEMPQEMAFRGKRYTGLTL